MKRKFDTLFGQFIYNKRIAIMEPVFGNLKNKEWGDLHCAAKRK
jgi:hypothetical protein